ncbi:hypothetical protein [Mycetocola saprophilus]|uniref:hypothetical protein n=1 Tax=Mycetocola saprophilus TaxID=76636 RepID=UPI0004C0D030|nr:hypothetical protein [Mycetocola saprophilus]
MSSRLRMEVLPGFQEDLDALPDLRTRKMTIDLIVAIRDGTVRGVPLDDRVATGDLRDCFKLYFDPIGNVKPRFRLVYRFASDGIAVVAVQAVAVGRRQGLDAYFRAARRLDRLPD